MLPTNDQQEGIENLPSTRPTGIESGRQRFKVLIATADPAVHRDLSKALEDFPLETIWVKGVEAVKIALSRHTVAACFCGVWLQDGTYRELVRHLRGIKLNVPSIIVGGSAASDVHSYYRGITTSGVFDFLCHPYSKSDLEQLLGFTSPGLSTDAGTEQYSTPSPAIPSLELQTGTV